MDPDMPAAHNGTGYMSIEPKLLRSPDLMSDLTALSYSIDDRMISIEKKTLTKKRIGRSPDIGDAVMHCYALTRGEIASEGVSGMSRFFNRHPGLQNRLRGLK